MPSAGRIVRMGVAVAVGIGAVATAGVAVGSIPQLARWVESDAGSVGSVTATDPGARSLSDALPAARPPSAGPATGAASPQTRQRPFRHEQHEAVTCSACHGTGEDHRVTLIRTAADCAACHHDPGNLQTYPCAACHGPADMPPPGHVSAIFEFSVSSERLSRELPFDHDRHTPRECLDCHTAPITLEFERGCASCHEDHHQPAAECSTCHLPAEPSAHDTPVHLTCAGSGCHTEERVSGGRPELSRPFCLLCHGEQIEHEPGGDCAACHMIPANPIRVSQLHAFPRPSGGGP